MVFLQYHFFRLALVIVASCFAMTAHTATAFNVDPPTQDLLVKGGLYKGSVSVSNPRDEPLNVEMRIFERVFGADAAEELRPADDEFIVFPPQAIIPPKGRQTFRIQFALPANLEVSKSFRLRVGEILPPRTDSDQSGVRTRSEVGVAFHLVTEGMRPKISVAETKRVVEKGSPFVKVLLRNDGDKYAYLFDFAIEAQGRNIDWQAVRLVTQSTIFPPRSNRILYLPGEVVAPVSVVFP